MTHIIPPAQGQREEEPSRSQRARTDRWSVWGMCHETLWGLGTLGGLGDIIDQILRLLLFEETVQEHQNRGAQL